MKYIKIFIFITLVFINHNFVYGNEFNLPDKLGPNDFDYEIINSFIGSGQKGIITAFKGNPEMRGTELQLSYYIKEGQPFIGEYLIGNYIGKKIELKIFCILNYHQQEFYFNDKRWEVHVIELEPKERKIYPFKINLPHKGAYDFILLAVRSPDFDNQINIDVLYHRANIFAGDTAYPNTDYHSIGEKTALSNFDFILFLNKDSSMDNNFQPVVSEAISKQSEARYFLHTNNNQDITITSILLAFINYKQVRFMTDKVFFYTIPPKRRGILEVDFSPYIQKGNNEVLILNIENPYVDMEIRGNGNKMNRILTGVKAANRLTLSYQ